MAALNTRALPSSVALLYLASCTSGAAPHEFVFCMPDGFTFTVDDSQKQVFWADVQFAYGPDCTGRCLVGFDAVAEALHAQRAGDVVHGAWQTYVDRDDGVDERYQFSISATTPDDLWVDSQVYTPAGRWFGCEF